MTTAPEQTTVTRKRSSRRKLDDGVCFGEFLRDKRIDADMTLEVVARKTAVPHHILEKLEASELDSLPADVFVRGYISAYAKAVGTDAEEALRRYSRTGGRRSPRTTNLRNAIDTNSLGKAPSTVRRLDDSGSRDETKTGLGAQPPKTSATDGASDRSFLPVLRDDERDRRGVTLAVVIIVIVATLTMSYLLRRPSQTGDDYTLRDAPTTHVLATAVSPNTGDTDDTTPLL